MNRLFAAALATAATVTPALAAEPDDLILPAGFHASVVAEGLGPVRHLAVRDNGDIYVSTPRARDGSGGGIIALHLDADHKADQTEHFGVVYGGTGIRFYRGALYAASSRRVYRYSFKGKALLPDSEPALIVDNIPASREGNHAIAFDGKGNLFVSVDGSANICAAPAGTPPVGLKPCPDLGVRSGIWRFAAAKPNQKFAAGEQFATGIRDTTSLDFSKQDGALYAIMHGRDTTARQFPALLTQADDDHIADEMDKVGKGTDFGWPYTYYDGVRQQRLMAPEYGGDGKTQATGAYATPVVTFHSKRAAPLDLLFYDGKSFPAEYRGGAFVVLHAAGGQALQGGQSGDNVVFIPMDKSGKLGSPRVFADGFAGPDQASKTGRARYRPSGAAVGPDGALYVADSSKGRIWRIAYDGK